MKSIDLLEAIGEIDEKLIENSNKKKKIKKSLIISFAAAIACIWIVNNCRGQWNFCGQKGSIMGRCTRKQTAARRR